MVGRRSLDQWENARMGREVATYRDCMRLLERAIDTGAENLERAVLDKELVRELFRMMRPSELDAALQGMELLAQHANALVALRSKGRKR